MASTDAKTLIAAIRDQSKGAYKVISGGKHMKVIHAEGPKKGRSVVDDNGPLIISASPSEARNRELAVHRLMSAGVLQWDPWKGKPAKSGKTFEEIEEEQRQGRRLRKIEESSEQQDKSQELRAKLEPFFVKIGGGYSKRGFAREFSRTVFYWLKERGSTFGYTSEGSFYDHIKNLGKGNTIPLNAVMAITEFLDAANSELNPRSFYMHLVGLAKGSKPTRQLPTTVTRTNPETGLAEAVILPDTDNLELESKPSVWDFVSLAALHERSGLKWSIGLTLDEYAELQRAVGFIEAVILRDYGEKGEYALRKFSEFLIKMGEARFYTMADREEAKE